MTAADEKFVESLRAYLNHGNTSGIEPTTPIFKNSDGTINREKTLALPCYMDMPVESLKE